MSEASPLDPLAQILSVGGKDPNQHCLIFVPTPESALLSDPLRALVPNGTALVGGLARFGIKLLIDYQPPTTVPEDDQSRWPFARTVDRFSDRVAFAADRYFIQQPTERRLLLAASEIVAIGMYDQAQQRIRISDYHKLEAWLTP